MTHWSSRLLSAHLAQAGMPVSFPQVARVRWDLKLAPHRVETFKSSSTRSSVRSPSYRFTDSDGAGSHCEIVNRSVANRQILDWLDDTLHAVA